MNNIEALAVLTAKNGLDAMIVGKPSRVNRRYLGSFRCSGSVIVVPAQGTATMITDGRYAETAAERAEANGYVPVIVESNADYDGALVRLVASAGYKRLGIERESVTVGEYDKLRRLMPDCELIPVSSAVESLREAKSPEEIEKIRRAQRITEKAYEEILNFIRPGVTEREIASQLASLMYLNGAEDLSFPVYCLSGENSSRPHGATGERRIREGEFVMMDFGAVKDGYYSDMTRTVAVGYATDEMRQYYDVVLEAQAAGMKAAKAGTDVRDVEKTARDVMRKYGCEKNFRHLFGHGVGLSVAELPFSDSEEEHILPEGAVMSAEPGVYFEGRFGIRTENLICIRKDGAEDLTLAPKQLMIL